MNMFRIIVLSLICVLAFTFGEVQRVRVKGKLLCGKQPAKNVKVKLVDLDWISDDTMDEKKTNNDGEFLVDGQTEESGDIDPCVKIYHDCYDGLPCQRTWKFEIPKKYIGRQGQEPPVVDVGIMNLEMWWYDEERNCI